MCYAATGDDAIEPKPNIASHVIYSLTLQIVTGFQQSLSLAGQPDKRGTCFPWRLARDTQGVVCTLVFRHVRTCDCKERKKRTRSSSSEPDPRRLRASVLEHRASTVRHEVYRRRYSTTEYVAVLSPLCKRHLDNINRSPHPPGLTEQCSNSVKACTAVRRLRLPQPPPLYMSPTPSGNTQPRFSTV